MSVPLLEPNYIGTMRSLEAQARENEKNRAAQARENNKQFGFDIGKALLAGGLNMGADALSKHLGLPLELAKLGGYGPDDDPAPDVTPTTPAVDDAVRGAALSVLADKVKAPPVETAPSPQPAPMTPPKPFSLKPPSAIQPETPDAQNPTFAKGLPTEETPVTKDWGGLAPRPVVAPEPTAVNPVAATPAEPSADHGIGARFKQLAADRTTAPQPEPISETKAALYRISKLARDESSARALRDRSYAASLSAKPEFDLEMRDAKLALLNAQAKAAQARAEKDHPSDPAAQARAMEEDRAKAWIEAGKLSKNIEKRVSSSGARGPGVSNGSVVVNVGGGSSNSPIFKAVVYANEAGYPVIVGADATGKFKYAGSVVPPLAPSVPVPARPASSGPVQRKATAPAAAPQATEGTAAPQKPITEITDPVELTRRENELRAAMDRAAVEGASPRDRAATEDAATLAAIARQRKLLEDQKAASAKPGGASNTAAHQAAYQKAVSGLQGIGATESKIVQGRISATDELFPITGNFYRGSSGNLSASSMAKAKAGMPYAPTGDAETDSATRPVYEKVRQTYAAARQEGAADFSRQKVAAAKMAMLGYFQAHPAEQGVSLSKMLGDWGVSLSDSERREVLRALQPDQPKLAPGPAESSPGQLPPPPKAATPAAPAAKSKADDLFDRINAQPWSKEKKRRVFLATAQRDGLK